MSELPTLPVIRAMRRFRLYNLKTTTIEPHAIDNAPPYIATSHTWAEKVFETDVHTSFGGFALRETVARILPHIQHCWIDTICILQDNEEDKFEQIPLMSHIYRNADTVVVALRIDLGLTQSMVNSATRLLQEELEVLHKQGLTQPFFDIVAPWAQSPKREYMTTILQQLEPLTQASWATRVWTLQEYILARNVVWIGTDLKPLIINDDLFRLLLEMSSVLFIRSTLTLDAFRAQFMGMSNLRHGRTNCTRAIELLGDRTATQPADEIYGVMAACGVSIPPIRGESKYQAWERWWERAIYQGNVRWALLVPSRSVEGNFKSSAPNCLIPSFGTRHIVSRTSGLDTVVPIDRINVTRGTITLQGYLVGRCISLEKLDTFHTRDGLPYLGITIVLFTRGSWLRAYQVMELFEFSGCNERHRIFIAQILVDNYGAVLRCVKNGKENSISYIYRTVHHRNIWLRFLRFGVAWRYDVITNNTLFRVKIWDDIRNKTITTTAILEDYLPTGELIAIGFNAFYYNDPALQKLLLAEVPGGSSSLHKVGMTTPVHNRELLLPETRRPQIFSLGGSRCDICKKNPRDRPQVPTEKAIHDIKKIRSYIAPEKVGFVVKRRDIEKAKRLKTIRRSLDLRSLIRWRRRSLCLRPMH